MFLFLVSGAKEIFFFLNMHLSDKRSDFSSYVESSHHILVQCQWNDCQMWELYNSTKQQERQQIAKMLLFTRMYCRKRKSVLLDLTLCVAVNMAIYHCTALDAKDTSVLGIITATSYDRCSVSNNWQLERLFRMLYRVTTEENRKAPHYCTFETALVHYVLRVRESAPMVFLAWQSTRNIPALKPVGLLTIANSFIQYPNVFNSKLKPTEQAVQFVLRHCRGWWCPGVLATGGLYVIVQVIRQSH